MSNIIKERACVADSCRQGCDTMSVSLGGLLFFQKGSKHIQLQSVTHQISQSACVFIHMHVPDCGSHK